MLPEGGISDEKIEIDSWRCVFRMKILKKSNVLPEGGISVEKIGFFQYFHSKNTPLVSLFVLVGPHKGCSR